MYVFALMYKSPRGFRIREYEAETCEDGKREAREYCDRPGYEQIVLSFYRKSAGDTTRECGDQPPEIPAEDFGPDVLPAHSDNKDLGDVYDASLRRGRLGGAAARGDEESVFERDGVLGLGEAAQVALLHLEEHGLFVDGSRKSDALEPSPEVTDLARVGADAEEVDEQVEGRSIH